MLKRQEMWPLTQENAQLAGSSLSLDPLAELLSAGGESSQQLPHSLLRESGAICQDGDTSAASLVACIHIHLS